MAKVDELTEMLRPAAEALGYEFLGIEYISQGKHSVLRIYIDHENGITVDDCASVSHQVSGILEVEDPISSQFNLEVSSPGLDRPLFTLAHFQQFIGHEMQVRCHVGVQGRRKFKGKLESVHGEQLKILVDNQEFLLEFGDIDRANLVADFS
ncbi:ribosome maturation factor RimP [Aliikangiella maris]|uniref:Ribosome maturation factor RimP n=2 Tax=Aliikangiella maris TaxID=3162458 RepID=A0ABV3MLL7_9GAMM